MSLAYNQVIDLLRSVDSYDAETGARGALLGDSTVARVDRSLAALALQRLEEDEAIEGYRGLWELGVRMGSSGRLEPSGQGRRDHSSAVTNGTIG